MNICLIAESSWDIECVEKQGHIIDSCFAHNDFFNSANEKNNRLIFRLIMLIKIFLKTTLWLLKCKKVFFSSFNAEALLVAKLFSKSQDVFLFCPNVMAKPSTNKYKKGKYLHDIYNAFTNKIIVTDKVTYEGLKDYSPVLSKNYYDFLVPKENELHKLLFIVVMPAVLSHKATANKHNDFYNFSLYIIEWLINSKLDFVVLPHPRENNDIKKILIASEKIKFINQKELLLNNREKCYLSSFSSLSLNKRYGGTYGFWVKYPEYNLLPTGISDQYLIDLKDICLK